MQTTCFFVGLNISVNNLLDILQANNIGKSYVFFYPYLFEIKNIMLLLCSAFEA